jgi:hypothetical protein
MEPATVRRAQFSQKQTKLHPEIFKREWLFKSNLVGKPLINAHAAHQPQRQDRCILVVSLSLLCEVFLSLKQSHLPPMFSTQAMVCGNLEPGKIP